MKFTRIRMVNTGTKDRYNNPVLSREETELEASEFAPQVSGETAGAGQIVSRDGGTLYFESPLTADLRPDDLVSVDGVEYAIDGPVASWPLGDIAVLKRAEYVDG